MTPISNFIVFRLTHPNLQTQIHVDRDGSYYEVSISSDSTGDKPNGGGKRLETAQVSLNDCLACR